MKNIIFSLLSLSIFSVQAQTSVALDTVGYRWEQLKNRYLGNCQILQPRYISDYAFGNPTGLVFSLNQNGATGAVIIASKLSYTYDSFRKEDIYTSYFDTKDVDVRLLPKSLISDYDIVQKTRTHFSRLSPQANRMNLETYWKNARGELILINSKSFNCQL